MKSKSPLIAIGIILLVGAISAVVYGVSMNKSDDMASMNMSTDNSSSSKDSVSTKDAVAADSVKIENFAYSPSAIKVKKGTTVTWTNNDSVEHNVVGDDYSDLNGKLLKKGESFSFTFNETGTYGYHCAPHPYMKGTVVVTE